MKAAATETPAMRIGSSGGDHGVRAITTMATVFNNLRVVCPSFSHRSPDSLSDPRHV
jgi:hypothetical protein